MSIELYSHQEKAVKELHNGSILCGGVGTGKSRTALAYYYLQVCEGSLKVNGKGSLGYMKKPRDLYIITTAKKRDSGEWVDECAPFCLSIDEKYNISHTKVIIDSWNNIKKYQKTIGAFFIFDEQRVVGSGAWVKAFLDISRKNQWILLSATPGDTWTDYIPVFVANGFFKNKTEFYRNHVIFDRFAKYPKINRFINIDILEEYKRKILVMMEYKKKTEPYHLRILVDYNKELYNQVVKYRWDPYKNEPIKEVGKLFYLMREVVNSDISRIEAFELIINNNDRCIVFYNFDYELDILRSTCIKNNIVFSEWNGKKHESIPNCKKWIYIVQYNAGAEGWNCIDTNVMIFYSQNYSYRLTIQASGRIDRMNTKYDILYYYHLISKAPIDIAISKALATKKNFNERSFERKCIM